MHITFIRFWNRMHWIPLSYSTLLRLLLISNMASLLKYPTCLLAFNFNQYTLQCALQPAPATAPDEEAGGRNTIAFDVSKDEIFSIDRNLKLLYKRLKIAWKVVKYVARSFSFSGFRPSFGLKSAIRIHLFSFCNLSIYSFKDNIILEFLKNVRLFVIACPQKKFSVAEVYSRVDSSSAHLAWDISIDNTNSLII